MVILRDPPEPDSAYDGYIHPACAYPVMFGAAPNITGDVTSDCTNTQSGIVSKASASTTVVTGNWRGGHANHLDASTQTSLFGRSSTVQPASVCVLPAIKF